MKKIIVVALVFLFLTVSVKSVFAFSNSRVKFDTLPASSKYVGSYYGYFCISESRCSEDGGIFTAWNVFFSHPHVSVGQLNSDSAYLSLSARPDYAWVWHDGNLFQASAYYLEKVK